MIHYILVISSVLVASIAQMLLKKGASMQYESFIREYLNGWVLGGYALMGVSLLVNIFALSKGVLVKEIGSLESLSYLFVPLLALLCFKERITARKVLSVMIIMLGILVFFWQ